MLLVDFNARVGKSSELDDIIHVGICLAKENVMRVVAGCFLF